MIHMSLLSKIPERKKYVNAVSVSVLECPPSSLPLAKCQEPSEWLSALWVPKCSLSALLVSLNVLCVRECLIRCDWNKILGIENYFMYKNKENFWSRIRALIWKAFDIGHINLIFVKIEFGLLWGNL